MAEQTSLRNCTYGFEQDLSGRKVYSNLPAPYLADWFTQLEETNQKREVPFLDHQDIVLVDTNQPYLDHVLNQLFPDFLKQAKYQKKQIKRQAHHINDSFLDIYTSSDGSPISKIYGRVKGLDSITEKLTRKFAGEGTMESSHPQLALHVIAEDIYAFTLVAQDEETLYKTENRLKSDPHLQMIDRQDHLKVPKPSGYRALQTFHLWKANTLPAGTLIEVHLETIEDHQGNRKGTPEHPERAHPAYSKHKLTKPHHQGNHQIIILQKNGSNRQETSPVKITNDYVDYYLINY